MRQYTPVLASVYLICVYVIAILIYSHHRLRNISFTEAIYKGNNKMEEVSLCRILRIMRAYATAICPNWNCVKEMESDWVERETRRNIFATRKGECARNVNCRANDFFGRFKSPDEKKNKLTHIIWLHRYPRGPLDYQTDTHISEYSERKTCGEFSAFATNI